MQIKQNYTPVNFSKNFNQKKGICIHTAVGSYSGTISWFKNPSAQVSSHYVINEAGTEITQCVRESDRAWAQGTKYRVTAPLVKRLGGNPNNYLISIECADGRKPHEHDRTGQYKALAWLVADIAKRNNIPLNREHVIGHKEIRASKTCPGNIDINQVLQIAKGGDMSKMEIEKKTFEELVTKATRLDEALKGKDEHLMLATEVEDVVKQKTKDLSKKITQLEKKHVPEIEEAYQEGVADTQEEQKAEIEALKASLSGELLELGKKMSIPAEEVSVDRILKSFSSTKGIITQRDKQIESLSAEIEELKTQNVKSPTQTAAQKTIYAYASLIAGALGSWLIAQVPAISGLGFTQSEIVMFLSLPLMGVAGFVDGFMYQLGKNIGNDLLKAGLLNPVGLLKRLIQR